ncbi:CD276 antigen-like [Oreochromis niloticus]|uniref:CD276 antigen-like n=1 Tax=Oreochromis niloticus TaxID=8128 RepID=UPI0009048F80|nr:CD276 antigen-like [Oreochromis niloticus]
MASGGTLLFIFTVLCINAVKSGGFIKVECKTKNVGHYGQQSLLECVVKTSTDAPDPTIRAVAWKKLTSPEDEGDLLLGFNRGKWDQPKRGYRFAEPLWDEKNMNVSLLITNTAVADDGYYKCMVITDSGDNSMVTTLKVQARYSVPTVHSIPEKIVPNTNSTLICESHGGYPKGTLHWFDEEGNDWTKSSEMEATQSDDGLFQLTSRLLLFRGATFQNYTCVVFNASGGKEDEIIFEMPAPPRLTPPSGPEPIEICKIVVRLVVIGSLMVGLLCVLLFCRWKAQQVQKCSTEPRTVGHHAVYRPEVNL